MEPLRVLIVEDEPIVSMLIDEIVETTVPSVVIIKSSLQGARSVIDEPFDLALLDVDVTNGKTYEIAQILSDRHVRCAFVSGSARTDLPKELRGLHFVQKPFAAAQIRDVVLTADRCRTSGLRNVAEFDLEIASKQSQDRNTERLRREVGE